MKNIKEIIEKSLIITKDVFLGTALFSTMVISGFAFLALVSSTSPTKLYTVGYGDGYKCESRLRTSQVRMFKENKLVAKKTYQNDQIIYDFFNNQGENFARAELFDEMMYKGEFKQVAGNLTLMQSDFSAPLWYDVVEGKLEGTLKELGGNFPEQWNTAQDLFVDFIRGERLLERAYHKNF